MKKNLVVLLLVLVVVSFGLFAAPDNPDSVGFDVKTSVSAINEMKLTKAAFSGTDLSSAAAFKGNINGGDGSGWSVTAGGSQSGLAAHISTLSNNRAGYTVKMSATPMKSTIGTVDACINYTVSTDGTEAGSTEAGSFNTSEDVDPVEVIKVISLTQLTGTSRKISITVDADEFAAAVEGNYKGTITFAYTAN